MRRGGLVVKQALAPLARVAVFWHRGGMVGQSKDTEKAERLREALRANLRRRKTQAQDRNREKPASKPTD